MLQKILAISGKPGLYKLISRGNRFHIVETLDEKKKRMPAQGNDKVISLNDIAMYTEDEEVPLPQVFEAIKKLQNGKAVEIDWKKADKDELFGFFAEVLPTFDRDRVHTSDIKKLIQWYNLLLENGITDFVEEEKKEEENTTAE